MTKNNNFIQQTHFIGVLVPEDITHTLEDCRRYMNQTYGCKSGYGTPIHITLVPPFCLPEEFSTEDLVFSIKENVLSLGDKIKFYGHIENFDAFGDRTIFAKVIPNKKWTILRDKTLEAVFKIDFSCAKKDKRPFQPHLTVANRDIPFGASVQALEVMNELNLIEDFPVDNITIFERKGNKWCIAWSGEL
ncbi:MAG: 2'-5' RNA ligase family protein [Spirochaetaceae bacterium]|nr:2'-5' RNA ligase family protein [Spirochaetaceae bacterium]